MFISLLGIFCEDCGGPIGFDDGPPDGWQLEDGRTVCQKCCVDDTGKIIDTLIAWHKEGSHDRTNI